MKKGIRQLHFTALLTFILCWGATAQETVSVLEWIHRSQEAVAENDLDAAMTYAQKATDTDPAQPGAWKQVGIVHLKKGEHQNAAHALGRSVELKSEQASTWRDYALSLRMKGSKVDAMEALQEAIRQQPDNASWHRTYAQWLWEDGRHSEAVAAVRKAVEKKPDYGSAWRDLGWYLWEDQQDEAIEAFDRAIEAGIPEKGNIVLNVAAHLAETGQEAKSISLLRRWAPNQPMTEAGIVLVEQGRIRAAEPILQEAWKKEDNKPIVGLYLAYSRILGGQCKDSSLYLSPLVDTALGKASARQLDILFEVLDFCNRDAELLPLIDRIDGEIKRQSARNEQVTDVLEKVAETRRVQHEKEQALRLYQRVSARDPNRTCWVYAFNLLQDMRGEEAALAYARDLLDKTTEESVKEGLKGALAERLEQWDEAAKCYRSSLHRDPRQPEIRIAYFWILLQRGELEQAREQALWFAEKVNAGNMAFRSRLASMWAALAEPQKALALWEPLHEEFPGNTYYALGAARALFALCQPDAAMQILQTASDYKPDADLYELMAAIQLDLGKTEASVELSEQGLITGAGQNLRRTYSESAEAGGYITLTNWEYAAKALQAAQQFIREDPSYIPMNLLAGRTYEQLGFTNRAYALHENLLSRNPGFLPSLLYLRNAATASGAYREAVDYAERAVALMENNPDTVIRYAMSLADNDQFPKGLKALRQLASHDAENAVPVLLYSGISDCEYPGRNNLKQIGEHIASLAEAGYTFVTPDRLGTTSTNPMVIVAIMNTEADVIQSIDTLLQRYGACAVYGGGHRELRFRIPGRTTPAQWQSLQDSGRWFLASRGPDRFERHALDEDGNAGNPLTHRLLKDDGSRETLEEYEQRIHQTLNEYAGALSHSNNKVLILPRGDFGQMSLDTGKEQIDIMKESLRQHFDVAFYYDASGFMDTTVQSLYASPAKNIPPAWSAADLLQHIKIANPYVRSRLELGKMLYWQRQHEKANHRFAEALAAGADERDVYYNWGINALQQGDLPRAHEKLQQAAALDADSQNIQEALQRVKRARAPRAEGYVTGWDDNEDREYLKYGIDGQLHLADSIELGAFVDQNRWSKEGLKDEEGTRAGGQLRWNFYPQRWIDLQVWHMAMDTVENEWGGRVGLTLPNRLLGGYVRVEYARQEIETLEAILAGIWADSAALRTYSRLLDEFDLFADIIYTDRDDGNETTMLNGRLVYRVEEWPFFGIGWLFRFADSDIDPDEYWAPEALQQHQLYGNLRGAYERLHYSLSGQAGYAKEEDTEWRFVWGARGLLSLKCTDHIELTGEAYYFEGPQYERLTWYGGVRGRF